MSSRTAFNSRISFYLVAIGSACGLGNIWRFPYVVGENGGGAFLLLYVFISFTLGISLLVAELILGQTHGSSFLKIMKDISLQQKKPFHWVARLSLTMSLVILAYYSVIAGWVIHYITRFITVLLESQSADQVRRVGEINLSALFSNGWLQFALASVHLVICYFIVLRNITERFETFFTKILPIFVVLVLLLLIRSLSLESSPDALRFLFYPDFSKLNLTSLGRAIGHVLYTLSLGMGIMVTFGSYFKKEENLPSLGFRVTIIDTVVSLVAVLIVFPILFLNQSSQLISEPGILFDSLPSLFSKIKYGLFFGLVFFISLWLVALNASIVLIETLMSNINEKLKINNRHVSGTLVALAALALALFPAFSSTTLQQVKIFNRSFIENLDSILINYFLPFSALLFIVGFFKAETKSEMRAQFVSQRGKNSQAMFTHWVSLLYWFAPGLIILALVMQFINLIRYFFN